MRLLSADTRSVVWDAAKNDVGDFYDGNLLSSAKTDRECAAACKERYSSDEYYVGFDFKSRFDGHSCYCLTAMSSGNIISTEAHEWCEDVVCYIYISSTCGMCSTTVYQDGSYRGRSAVFTPATSGDIDQFWFRDNDASSIKVAGGSWCRATVFGNKGFSRVGNTLSLMMLLG